MGMNGGQANAKGTLDKYVVVIKIKQDYGTQDQEQLFIYFLVVMDFELRPSHLLGSTILLEPCLLPFLLWLF
jgi:hypothetical protein